MARLNNVYRWTIVRNIFYKVIGFKREIYGLFAVCKEIGTDNINYISTELLDDPDKVFYELIN